MKVLIISSFIFLFTIESSAEHVQYRLKVSYMEGYPDGVKANYILTVNGQFPGPTLEATVGDTVEVTLVNEIQDRQNVTLHWHGLHQRGTIFEDGVSMITQCPLAAGHEQVYHFNATQAGTYWYHSHFKSQYTEGLFGPLIIHGKPEVHDYHGEATLMLSDWYHRSAKENEHWYLTQESFGQPPLTDSVLINGMGLYSCASALLQNMTCHSRKQMRQVIRINKDKPYRIRVINASSRTTFNFSIAQTDLKVIEADSVDVGGHVLTHVVPIAAGQRYSFIVQCPKDAKSGSRYLIRADSFQQAVQIEGIVNINRWSHAARSNVTAVLECTDEDLNEFRGKAKMTTEHHSWMNPALAPVIRTPPGPKVLNEMDLKPFDGIGAPKHVDEEHLIEVTFMEGDEDDVRRPNINFTTFTYPDDKPLLHKLIAGEKTTNEMVSVEIKYGNVIQLVINNHIYTGTHPFHLHGHHFWIVGIGKPNEGNYDPAKHKLTVNGVKRDTISVQHNSWAVIRFVADNPGVWLFHCHQDWHAVGGMTMVFVEGLDILQESVPPSEESLRVCELHQQNSTSNVANGKGMEWWPK